MPHTHAGRSKSIRTFLRGRTQGRSEYKLFGTRKLTFYDDSDAHALVHLAKHFGVPKITLETFARAGGTRLMCGSRRVFPPPGINA